jgi:hypothetical protein
VRELRTKLGANDFSVDVESKVRLEKSALGEDLLTIDLCEAYFEAVIEGLQSSR